MCCKAFNFDCKLKGFRIDSFSFVMGGLGMIVAMKPYSGHGQGLKEGTRKGEEKSQNHSVHLFDGNPFR